MSSDFLQPVILCGGSGTRLWPLSRKSYPKQFLEINSSNNLSLLQQTQKRIESIDQLNDPILICNEEHRFIIAEQMREININPKSIILEPIGRNTAPAIIISALIAAENGNNPTLLVLSSDHEIKDNSKFLESISFGQKSSCENKLVTFGIIPTSPETGYGYIESKSNIYSIDKKGDKIIHFKEKPNLEVAKKYLQDMHHTWNSGMFMFKANTIIEEAKLFFPEILEICKKSLQYGEKDLDFLRLSKNHFEKCPNISIDNAILEKTDKGIVIPLEAGWSDVGSWEKVWENSKKDKNGNFVKGHLISRKNKNCYLRSEDRLLVAIGLEDLIILETNDAILVSKRKHSQELKEVVEILKREEIPQGIYHSKRFRPWGSYTSKASGDGWQVKLITVKPYEKLSLQMHKYRSEHWIIVSGVAKVEINDKVTFLKKNESTFIPIGSKHRLTNPEDKPLELIEVQNGSYLGEDDIIRFEDKYGRSN